MKTFVNLMLILWCAASLVGCGGGSLAAVDARPTTEAGSAPRVALAGPAGTATSAPPLSRGATDAKQSSAATATSAPQASRVATDVVQSSAAPATSAPQVFVGLGPSAAGWFEGFTVDIAHPTSLGGLSYLTPTSWMQLKANGYALGAQASTSVCSGDVDGDGVDELVVGTGPGGQGRVYIYKKGVAGYYLANTLQLSHWDSYNMSADSSTWPACVDIDGDGRAEIVIGTGKNGQGWVQIWRYSSATLTFNPMYGTPFADGYLQVGWPQYNASADGSVHPAGGWISGHAAGQGPQLVLGLGSTGQGWLQIWTWMNSMLVPYRRTPNQNGWVQVDWSAFNSSTDASTWPAVGDYNGDGFDDLVVGLGDAGQGWVELFASRSGDVQEAGWKQVAWSAYDTSGHAGVHPSMADLDGDGRADIVMGLSAAGQGWLYVLRGGTGKWTDSWAQVDWPLYAQSGNAPTWATCVRASSPSPSPSPSPLDFIGGVAFPLDAGAQAAMCIMADMNGDGVPDLIVLDTYNQKVYVCLHTTSGGFGAPITVKTSAPAQCVTATDVDGDGMLDLVVSGNAGLQVLLARGNGVYSALPLFGEPSCYSHAVADLNGDGRPDLVVQEDLAFSTWLSNGDGTFTFKQRFTSVNNSVPVLGDFDEDGRIDLSSTEFQSNFPGPFTALRNFWRGNGDGTFAAPRQETAPLGGIASADFNGDHHLDLVIGNQVFLGNGNGTFQALPPFTAASVGAIAPVDLDGDGRIDLVYQDNSGGFTALQLGRGDGTFAATVSRAQPGPWAAGDVNGDGRADLVVCARSAVDLLAGNGDGSVQSLVPQPGFYPAQVAKFGVNQILGALFVTDGNLPRIGSSKPDATFYNFMPLTSTVNAATAAVAGDLNGDGVVDVVSCSGTTYTVYLGNADTTFQAGVVHDIHASSPVGWAGNMALADVNRDGRLDLIIFDCSNSRVLWTLLGNGDGTFQAASATAVNASSTGPDTLVVGDFNNDLQPDIAASNSELGTVQIFTGRGDGTFAGGATVHIFPTSGGVASLGVGDFNGDGRLDIAATDDFGSVWLALGNGDASFQPSHAFASGGSGPGKLATTDLDGYGRTDVVTTNQNIVSIFYADSNGQLRAPQVYATGVGWGGSIEALDVVIGDFNGDHKLDVLTSGGVLLHR